MKCNISDIKQSLICGASLLFFPIMSAVCVLHSSEGERVMSNAILVAIVLVDLTYSEHSSSEILAECRLSGA